jgi:hypothetical protein
MSSRILSQVGYVTLIRTSAERKNAWLYNFGFVIETFVCGTLSRYCNRTR